MNTFLIYDKTFVQLFNPNLRLTRLMYMITVTLVISCNTVSKSMYHIPCRTLKVAIINTSITVSKV